MLDREKIENAPGKILGRLHGDKVIWSIVLILTLVSILVIYSSSSTLAFKRNTTNFSILLGQLKYTCLGFVALYACYKIPIRWYRYLAAPSLIVTIFFLLATVMFGSEINGAVRGLRFGGITFQPSELAKVTVVLYLARIIEVSKLETFKEYLIKIGVPIGIVILLIAYGSISMALIICIITFAILIVTGIKWSYIFKTILIATTAVVLLIAIHLIFPSFLKRLDTATGRIERFFKSNDNENNTKELTREEIQKIEDENLQENMARLAVKSGKLFGKGPGKSTQRFILPHPYSDFAYSTIIEEYGLLLGLFVMFCYIWLMFGCVSLSKRCKTVFSSVTVGGIGFAITLQAFLHIMVNVGILPITGHTLPVISLGGSSLVIILASFGVILSISRTKEIATAKANIKDKTEVENISDSNDSDITDNEQS